MTFKESLEILELTEETLTKESLKISFRNLSKKSHPDINGSNEQFIQLTEAYNNLSEHLKSYQLMKMEIKSHLQVEISKIQRTQEVSNQSRDLSEKILRYASNKYRETKQIATALGILTALIAAGTKYVYSNKQLYGTDNYKLEYFDAYLILIGIFIALAFAYYSFKENDIKIKTDEFLDLLQNKRDLRKILIEIIGENTLEFTSDEFDKFFAEWNRNYNSKIKLNTKVKFFFLKETSLNRYVKSIGADEFKRLILLKAEDKNLLTCNEIGVDNNAYKLAS